MSAKNQTPDPRSDVKEEGDRAFVEWLASPEYQAILLDDCDTFNESDLQAAFAAGQKANLSEIKEVREKLFLEIRGLVEDPIAEDARLWDMVDFLTDRAKEQGRSETKADVYILLAALQWCYRKHHMGSDEIGWEELSEKMHNVLCNVMGDDGYIAWSKTLPENNKS